MPYMIYDTDSKTKHDAGTGSRSRIYKKFGGDVTINYEFYGMQKFTQNVTGVKVPLSGHWIPERPEFVVNTLNNFFGDANAKK